MEKSCEVIWYHYIMPVTYSDMLCYKMKYKTKYLQNKNEMRNTRRRKKTHQTN